MIQGAKRYSREGKNRTTTEGEGTLMTRTVGIGRIRKKNSFFLSLKFHSRTNLRSW